MIYKVNYHDVYKYMCVHLWKDTQEINNRRWLKGGKSRG